MRIIKTDISKIKFNYLDYNQELYNSIKRIGFSFPIQVDIVNDQYYCIDGHKRLSVLQDILINEPNYARGSEVCIVVKNNGNERSNDCWRGRNSH